MIFCIQDTLAYLKRMRLLKVKTPDNANRTMMVEEAKTVDQLMDVICQRIGITNTQEYSLASPRKAEVENVDTMRETKARELDALRSKIHTEAEGQLVYSLLKFSPEKFNYTFLNVNISSELVGDWKNSSRAACPRN